MSGRGVARRRGDLHRSIESQHQRSSVVLGCCQRLLSACLTLLCCPCTIANLILRSHGACLLLLLLLLIVLLRPFTVRSCARGTRCLGCRYCMVRSGPRAHELRQSQVKSTSSCVSTKEAQRRRTESSPGRREVVHETTRTGMDKDVNQAYNEVCVAIFQRCSRSSTERRCRRATTTRFSHFVFNQSLFSPAITSPSHMCHVFSSANTTVASLHSLLHTAMHSVHCGLSWASLLVSEA